MLLQVKITMDRLLFSSAPFDFKFVVLFMCEYNNYYYVLFLVIFISLANKLTFQKLSDIDN